MKGKTYVDPCFFAGFTLAGYRQPDGSIISLSGVKLMAWPETITIEGVTFTFEEEIFCGREDNPKGMFVNAEYM